MVEDGVFVENESDSEWSREIGSAEEFSKFLDSVGDEKDMSWFSVCVNGVSRSNEMNDGFGRAGINRAKKKSDDFVRKGMASHELDIQGRIGTGLDLGPNVVGCVNRLVAFSSSGENTRMNRLFIDGDAEKFVEDGADFKVYHVLLDEKVVSQCVKDWLRKR